jgi:hypothetical protein
MITLIPFDWPFRDILIIDYLTEPSLPQLYEWLECSTIQLLCATWKGEIVQLVIDEGGKLKEENFINVLATAAWFHYLWLENPNMVPNDVIVGSALFLSGSNMLS